MPSWTPASNLNKTALGYTSSTQGFANSVPQIEECGAAGQCRPTTEYWAERLRSNSDNLRSRLYSLRDRLNREDSAVKGNSAQQIAPALSINENLAETSSYLDSAHDILSQIEQYLF